MREIQEPTTLDELNQQLIELRNQFLQHNHSFIGSGVQQGEVISGFLRSSDYVAGSSGWMIGANDNCEFNSGTFRGTLSAASGTLGTITAGTIIGTTIKTSTGYTRIELTGDNYLNFYGENTLRGRIRIIEDGQYLQIDNQQSAAHLAAIRIYPSGDFYIDSEGASRLYIEAHNIKGFSTNFYPDTNNTGAIGALNYRWDLGYFNKLYCSTQTADQHITGDLKFKHKGEVVFRIDENPNFLNIYNKDNKKIAKFDKDGNLWLKGGVRTFK